MLYIDLPLCVSFLFLYVILLDKPVFNPGKFVMLIVMIILVWLLVSGVINQQYFRLSRSSM